jgi:hypothetical protein
MLRRGLVGLALVALWPGVVLGQARDSAGAEKLYDDGAKLLAKDDWVGACAKFADSFKLDPAPGTQLNLAACSEHEGKLALAWSRLKDARSLNADTKSETQRKQIESFIQATIERLEPRLPYLTVRIANAPAGAVALRDQQPMVVGVDLPVDPGKHVIVVGAPGYVEQTRELTLAEAQREVVEFTLLPQPKGSSGEGPMPDAGVKPKPDEPRPIDAPPVSEESALSGIQIGGLILGGVGVATLGASVALGVVALGKRDELDALNCVEMGDSLRCPPGVTQEAEDLSSSGSTLALVSTVTTFVGAAAAGAGVLMLILGGSDTEPAEVTKTGFQLLPYGDKTGAGLMMFGVFQ